MRKTNKTKRTAILSEYRLFRGIEKKRREILLCVLQNSRCSFPSTVVNASVAMLIVFILVLRPGEQCS
jgi:hypothetical protein